ncbi:MAG: SusC/RagA family TonB-linked outer membrane protein [Bacteroidota bacterium]
MNDININFSVFGKRMRTLLFLLSGLFFSLNISAQSTIKGKVVDAEGSTPLEGVNVVVKGSTKGAITNSGGEFSLDEVKSSDVLVFSYLGYGTMEQAVGNETFFNISLEEGGINLDEVTVTALGIKRASKSLGYAIQEVSGEDLQVVKTPNLLNNLTGKVAGVTITQGGSGVGSSARIVIRGESSLSGDNQPLFVVNGIPISNANGGNGRSQGNLEADYGNGAADISPDDIESISILRGANATALYGSRAANGVVLITTKSGRGTKGIGVSINSSTTIENPLRIPEYQNQYGQGAGFNFEFVDGFGSGTNDNIDESWGPALDGRMQVQHNSRNAEGLRAGDFALRPENYTDQSSYELLPWVPQPDNIENFFETGVTTNNNISITAANETSNFRLSFSNLYSEGILPNTDLRRNGVNLDLGHNLLNNRLHINTNINYINSGSNNRPNNSYGTENIMYLWVWFGRQIPMETLRDYWQPGLDGIQQFNYNYNWHDNPYFTMFENTNGFSKDRVLGNINISYDITDNLKFMVRTGTDVFNDLREGRRAWSTQRFPLGQYREDRIFYREMNTDFLLTYDDRISDNVSLVVSAGGNQMTQENRFNQVSANELAVPGIYSFNNSNIPLLQSTFNSKRRINSLYANASIGINDAIYLDLAGRNDWSSTLPEANNSYFYPSASLSLILNEIISLPSTVTFAKLRVGYGQVGNDTRPYSLQPYFEFLSTPYGTQLLGTEGNILPNPDLKPERLTTFEVGADLRFFDNRLGLDVTWYQNNATDQIISIPVSQTSGFGSKFINAGEIESSGIEALVNIGVVRNDDFKWNIGMNFTSARSKVISLIDDLEVYQISNNYLSVQARLGGRMGDVYGTGFVLVDPATNSTVTVDDIEDIEDDWGHLYQNGFPVRDPNLRKLGNYNPDFMLGIQNQFSFKGVNLGFLVDWRQGGVVMSRTLLIGGTSGLMAETAEFDREATTFVGGQTRVDGVSTLDRDGYIQDADGNFVTNDVAVSARDFYWSHFNRGNEEVGIYDASFVKLRELSIGYTFGPGVANKIGAQSISLSLIGRNLLLFTENPHFDPELFSYNGNTIVPGVEDMATPSSRSFGVNLGIKF